ncbi:hypothetical protein FZEAL_3459 [Fusarium zealandicum]|uniref:Uncharacterized protein n=1 Tax=Fusarium zealandicum TaxID=1053134 RepID=A0A8H4UPB4_9HYPO|nr:hypothetical protein FZEAL_3459 [Fusarium zealandicum]
MVTLKLILLGLLATSPGPASPAPQNLEVRAVNCANPKVKAFVTSAGHFASKEVGRFCSSYLGYKPKITTVTETITFNEVLATTLTSGTGTVVSTISISASATQTVTQTIGIFPGLEKREAAYAPPPAPIKKITADYHGKALGFPSSVVSGACSCLVKPPAPTTKTIARSTTETFWDTWYEYKTTTTTTASFPVDAVSREPLLTPRTDHQHTHVLLKPLPSPHKDLRDANPSDKDAFSDSWLATTLGDWWNDGSDVAAITPSKEKRRAVLVYLEAKTGFLRTVDGGWYLNNDPYNDLAILQFNSKKDIDPREYQYSVCKIVQSGRDRQLVCHVDKSAWDMRFYQTCPVYDEWFQRPFVVGSHVFSDIPCSQKKLLVVDPCA